MATVDRAVAHFDSGSLGPFARVVTSLGDVTVFGMRTLTGILLRRTAIREFIPVAYQVGVNSVTVVATTGAFIGMVLAVQTYGQFHQMGLDTWLGSIINMSIIRELGPVLAATMLAGRVGSAMAAELATMRVTEQIDALACLGVNPVYHLVGPRFLACVLMIPLLTILADVAGVLAAGAVCVRVFHIEAHHYWAHARDYVSLWDVWTGLTKPLFFGAALSLIACHRGFNSKAGAEGVGRAATEAFVYGFIAILAIDFFLAMFFNTLYYQLWPATRG